MHSSQLVQIIDTCIPLIFFLAAGFVTWKFFELRHRERMYLIETGTDSQMLRSKAWSPERAERALQLGLFALGMALGILGGFWIKSTFSFDPGIVAVLAIAGGGAGLVTFFFISARNASHAA
jgi:hypothetical protein